MIVLSVKGTSQVERAYMELLMMSSGSRIALSLLFAQLLLWLREDGVPPAFTLPGAVAASQRQSSKHVESARSSGGENVFYIDPLGWVGSRVAGYAEAVSFAAVAGLL